MQAWFVNCVQMTDNVNTLWVEAGVDDEDRKVVFIGMRATDGEELEITLHPGDAVILAEHIKRLALPERTTVFGEDPEF